MITSIKEMTDKYNEARLEDELVMTIEEMGAFVGYADLLCAWCGKYISTNPSVTGMTSHGICKFCEEKVNLEMALDEFKETPHDKMNVHLQKALQYNVAMAIMKVNPSRYHSSLRETIILQAHELMQVGLKHNLMRREAS